jgi:hypothetical protein
LPTTEAASAATLRRLLVNDEVDSANAMHMDRRSLLKKAGAAGALGLAAPISFDSFFSPAAAASCADLANAAVSSLTSAASISDSSSYATASVTPASGRKVLVAFSFSIATTTAALSGATVSGLSIGSVSQLAFLRYAVNQSGFDFYVAVYQATGTGNAGVITIDLGTGNTGQSLNHSVLVGSAEILSASLAGSSSGTSATTPGVSFTPSNPSSISVLVVSGQAAPNGNHTWTFNNSLSELTDVYADNGNGNASRPDLSLADGWKKAVTSPLTATPSTTLNSWGAIALELSC